MRKINAKKGMVLLLSTALVASTALTGCGKKKVKYNTGENGESTSAASGDLAGRLGIPESYNETINSGQSGVSTIKIADDDILVPTSDTMSTYYYTSNEATNEYKQTIAEALFDKSKGIYKYDWEKPYKGDIQEEIDTYKELSKAALDDGDSESVEWYESYIKDLEDQLEEASDEREGAGDFSASEFIGYVGENQFMLSFTNSTEGGVVFDYNIYPSDSYIKYKPYEGASMAYCYDGSYMDEEDMDDSSNKCNLSSEDAVKQAQNFLNSCGITDVVKVSVSDLAWEYDDSSYETLAVENNGYIVTFARSIDGQSPYNAYTYMLEYLSDEDVFYSADNETYTVYVDDNGIFEVSCYDMFRQSDKASEKAELMSWDKVLESLEKAVSTFYSENKTSYDTITFNDVRLTYYKMNVDGEIKYAPVWVFAECEDSDDGLDYDYPIQLIMLDASTGELVDLKSVMTATSYDYDDSDFVIGEGDYEDSDDGEEIVISDDEDEDSDDGDYDDEDSDDDEEDLDDDDMDDLDLDDEE